MKREKEDGKWVGREERNRVTYHRIVLFHVTVLQDVDGVVGDLRYQQAFDGCEFLSLSVSVFAEQEQILTEREGAVRMTA